MSELNDETYDKWAKKFFDLNPVGASYMIKSELIRAIESDNTPDDHEKAFEFLYNCYSRYIHWWKNEFGERNKSFIKEQDKLKDPYDFLERNFYLLSYGRPKSKREYYLFGYFEDSELKVSLKSFLENIGVSTGHIKVNDFHEAIMKNIGRDKEGEEHDKLLEKFGHGKKELKTEEFDWEPREPDF